MARRNLRELDVAESLVHMAVPGEGQTEATSHTIPVQGNVTAGAHGAARVRRNQRPAPRRHRAIRPAPTPTPFPAPAQEETLQSHLLRQQFIAGIPPENFQHIPQHPQGNVNNQDTPNLIYISNDGITIPRVAPATFIPRTRYPAARTDNDRNQGNNIGNGQFLTVPGEAPPPHEPLLGHNESAFNAPQTGATYGQHGFQGFVPAFPAAIPPFGVYSGGYMPQLYYDYQPGYHPVSNERGAPDTEYGLPPYVKDESGAYEGEHNMMHYPVLAPNTNLPYYNYGFPGLHGLPDLESDFDPFHTDAIVINPRDPSPPYSLKEPVGEKIEEAELTVQPTEEGNEVPMQAWEYLQQAAINPPDNASFERIHNAHMFLPDEPFPSIEENKLDFSHSQSTINMPLDCSHSQSTISMPLEPLEFDDPLDTIIMPLERNFLGLLADPKLGIRLTDELSVTDLINLWRVNKAIRDFMITHLPLIIKKQALHKSQIASYIFPWRCYQKLLFRRIAGLDEVPPARFVDLAPGTTFFASSASFRWLQMIRYRERTVTSIIRLLRAASCGFPRRYKPVLLKIWFLMDIPDNARRLWTIQNTNLWTDLDLFMAALFIVRIDMFVKINRGCSTGGQRRLIMAQPSLTFCLNVLNGSALRDQLEYLSALIRWRYDPVPDDIANGEDIFGVPVSEAGSLQYEGYGVGRLEAKKLRRPDDLILHEVLRRGLNLNEMYMRIFIHSQPEVFVNCERPGSPWDYEAKLQVADDEDEAAVHAEIVLDMWPI
ncbi:hypothetical protein BJX70DRAFT_398982 [Aspergillus crustosus]